jgi:hypothetical protein
LDFAEHEPVLALYRESAIHVIKDQAKRIEIHLDRLKNPAGVALLILLDEVGADLTSGRYHAGTGRLNGTGLVLTHAFAEIVRQLRESKTISGPDAAQALKTLRDTLAATG